MRAEGPIRVFVADDHELVRRGICDLVDRQADLHVVGEAATAASARARIAATSPDVAVLDVRMPDGSGIDVCRWIRQENPATACLILTAFDDEDALYAAVLAGAAGYVLKDIRGGGLLEAIRRVASGHSLLEPSLKDRAIQRLHSTAPRGEDPRLDALSGRERQILALISEGLSNRQIGERLGLAEKTVKNYVSALLGKLGLQRRTQAAVLGARGRSGP